MWWQYLIKVLLTALIVVSITELSKRSTLLGALLASLPLTSILAMIWLYFDTKNLEKITQLSTDIFWVVIPSLVFFIALPVLIKLRFSFWVSLGGSALLTSGFYWIYLKLLKELKLIG